MIEIYLDNGGNPFDVEQAAYAYTVKHVEIEHAEEVTCVKCNDVGMIGALSAFELLTVRTV